jgi:crotonobetainyl-CoA:carnitine CoA-transferase CaiB-like acyl-CoA transferase
VSLWEVAVVTSLLAGLKVIDLTVARAGPTTVKQLAEYGAEVIRIETPDDSGSIVRDHASSDYINLHGNKRLISLNLKAPTGREVLLKLLEDADVLVENFRPAVKGRLRIGFDDLAGDFPRLVYGSISGFGQSGPRADTGAVDQIMQGFAGLMSVTGDQTSGPMRAGIAVSDLAAGTLLTNGILLALLERERSGRGQWVQVSLLEAVLSFMDFQAARWTIDEEVPGPVGNHHPSSTPMGMFDASDGHLNIAAPSDRLFVRLCDAIGAPHLIEDERFATAQDRHRARDSLLHELQAIFKTKARAEWISRLETAGVPCGPVNDVAEVFADPQVVHLGVTEVVSHPARGDVRVLRTPIRMSRTQPVAKSPAPGAGEHTLDILAELGYSASSIDQLRADGAI